MLRLPHVPPSPFLSLTLMIRAGLARLQPVYSHEQKYPGRRPDIRVCIVALPVYPQAICDPGIPGPTRCTPEVNWPMNPRQMLVAAVSDLPQTAHQHRTYTPLPSYDHRSSRPSRRPRQADANTVSPDAE